MSGTLGRVDEFDGDKDDWQQYVERLEHFFVANGIVGAEKKRSVFLSVIGSSTYKTLRNLLSPSKPGEQSYADLVGECLFAGLDHWTGLLDWTTGLTFDLTRMHINAGRRRIIAVALGLCAVNSVAASQIAVHSSAGSGRGF